MSSYTTPSRNVRRTRTRQLPPVLRPRLTWRYIACSLAVLYIVYCWLFATPLFSSNLPSYTGPYPVGTIDIEVPCRPRTISDITRKDNGEPAFKLDTVLFSLYYPSKDGAKSSKPRHYWISPPIAIAAEGYARFAHISNFFTNKIFTFLLWVLAGGNRIPAEVDVPLRPYDALSASDGLSVASDGTHAGLPVIVFSHGMASSRTSYSQYCAELASRGYVVAAIEHRDGSGPGTVIMKDGTPNRNLLHLNQNHLHRNPPLDTPALKEAQLNFRQAEVEETVRVLRKINSGEGSDVFESSPRREGIDLKHWKGRLNTIDMTMSGHSYGATLALQVLKGGPSEKLPFKGAIILDPGKSSGPLNEDVRVPLLILHSNSWSKTHSIFYGRPHFEVVRDIVQNTLKRGHDAWFMTSLGTSHPSVTDAPLIEPLLLSWTTWSTIDVREGVYQSVKVSDEFMRYQSTGKKTGLLEMPVTHPRYDDDRRSDKLKNTMPEEYRKYWQIHVAPEQAF